MIFIASALSGLMFGSCALKPLTYSPKKAPSIEGVTQLNEKLLAADKISIDGWFGPEDILFDSLGNLYTGVHNADFSDGRILKIDSSGKVEEFYNSGSWVAGLHFDKERNLIALSHKQGLISISPEKEVMVLASSDENGRPFLIPNGTNDLVKAFPKPSFPDFIPTLEINGVKNLIADKLKWYQYVLGGLPILLIFVGGLVGGVLGALAAITNFNIFRQVGTETSKYLKVIGITTAAFILYFVLVTLITELIN